MHPLNQMSQSNAPNPMLQYYQQWSEKNSFFTRNITITLVVSYILSFFIASDKYFGNIPFFSIFHFEVYRILMSPFVGDSIMSLIIVIMMYPAIGSRIESSLGSSAYLTLIGTITLLVNLGFIAIVLFMYIVGTPTALFMGCSGFWNVLFALFTIECLQSPEQPRRMMFIPVNIPAKYMPLAFFVLISIFSGFQLSFALSILVGWAYMQGRLDVFKPSSYTLEEMETSGGILHSLSRYRGYVLAGAALGG